MIRHEEDFIAEFNLKNDKYILIGKYINSTTKVKVKCKKCGYENTVIPSNLLNNIGCPKCQIKSRSLSSSDFYEKYKFNNLKIIGNFISSSKKTKFKCLDCGHEFFAIPNSILNKNKRIKSKYCARCNNKEKNNTENFKKKMKEINKDIEILGEYFSRNNKIKCKCLKCNTEWLAQPTHLVNKHGCPECAKESISIKNTFLTTEIVSNRILLSTGGEIIPIGEYNNKTTRIKCICSKCKYEWNPVANNIFFIGSRCPNCSNISKLEIKTKEILDNFKINYIQQKRFEDCRNILPLPFDFYLPKYNICIECQGLQHYESVEHFGGDNALKERKKLDNIKENYCISNNIKLIKIKYNEIKQIENIIKGFLFC